MLDLRGVRFLDSTGLRLVLELDAAAKEASHELLIIRGSAVVQRIFEVTQVSERLQFVDAVERHAAAAAVGTVVANVNDPGDR